MRTPHLPTRRNRMLSSSAGTRISASMLVPSRNLDSFSLGDRWGSGTDYKKHNDTSRACPTRVFFCGAVVGQARVLIRKRPPRCPTCPYQNSVSFVIRCFEISLQPSHQDTLHMAFHLHHCSGRFRALENLRNAARMAGQTSFKSIS
jgi:hypothetical protein